MIKIPTQLKKHSVPGNSDLFGTIHYTKNINLDEEGYIKLSSRTVSIDSQISDSNIGLVTAFGKKSTSATQTEFVAVQNAQKAYWLSLTESEIANSIHIDNSATLTEDSHGTWFKNVWHITDTDDIFRLDSVADTATYTEITDDSPANLTAGVVHFPEVFRNKNALCVTNGNTVNLYTESGGTYTLVTTLTLPSEYEAVGLSYSNYQMGVITMPASTYGQNQDSYFFVWDGSTTQASAGHPIGSDRAIAIAPYKGTWIILTRSGELKMYNGGGFSDVEVNGQKVALPHYYRQILWEQNITRSTLGDVMVVDGDVIYINFNAILNAYGKNYEQVLPNGMGGILCLDPKVGLYNRYSPSISSVSMLTVTSGNIDTSTDIMTKTAGTIPSTGSPIKYMSDKTSQIGGLQCPKVYYCIKHSDTTFSLANSKAEAEAGVKVDLTSTGAANNYFLALEVYDYGASYATKAGAVALIGKTNPLHDHLIFSSELQRHDTTGVACHYELTVPDFENRGYFVTPKIQSSEIEDANQKIYIKYRPLKTNDKIVVKVKDKDLVGVPVSTPQARSATKNQCAWSGTDTFSTSADLSDAKTALDAGHELECEVIAGAGAGTLTKISSITYEAPTYTVVLEEDVDGAAASRYCDVLIENWKKLGEITSTDPNNYKSFLIGRNSSWVKFKIELRGSETTIEEVQIINQVSKPSA